MAIELKEYKLDAAFDLSLAYTPYGVLVEHYDGEAGACYLSRGQHGTPIATVTLGRKLDYGEPLVNLWIHNTKAQVGHKLKLLLATQNAIAALVMPLPTNPAHLLAASLVIGVVAVQFPAQPIPYDIEVVIIANETNTDTIYIGGDDVTTAIGSPLDAGDQLTLKVSDLSVIWAIAGAAAQDLNYIVEIV